jgi:Gpi18-like mannosyltransferase
VTSLRSAFLYVLKVFLGVRIGLFVLALLSPGLFPPIDPVSVPGWPARTLPDPGWHNLFTAWERFDALWYLRIADQGYRIGDGSAAFFPLYPLVTRFLSVVLGGRPFAASLLVSNGALLVALTLLYDLTRSELSDPAARTTVVLLCVFPTSFFLFAPYTESLFLLLAVAALWAARRERWWLAAAAGFGATLTRSTGAVVAVALLAEAIQRSVDGDRGAVGALAAAAATLAGTFAYLLFWQVKADDWLAPIHQQVNWERVFSWPWMTLIDGTRSAFEYVGATNGPYWTIDWLLVMPLIAASVVAMLRYRWAFRAYLLGGLLIPLSYVFPTAH